MSIARLSTLMSRIAVIRHQLELGRRQPSPSTYRMVRLNALLLRLQQRMQLAAEPVLVPVTVRRRSGSGRGPAARP